MNDIDSIYINLDIISQIPPNGRLSTTGQSNYLRLDTREHFQWLFRLINAESAEKAIDSITTIVTECIKHIKDSDDIKLKNALKKSVIGLINLRDTTYKSNITEKAKLNRIIEIINEQSN
jgi:hypothetical protein